MLLTETFKDTVKWVGGPLAVAHTLKQLEEQNETQRQILAKLKGEGDGKEHNRRRVLEPPGWLISMMHPASMQLSRATLRNHAATNHDAATALQIYQATQRWEHVKAKAEKHGVNYIQYMPYAADGGIVGTPRSLTHGMNVVELAIEKAKATKQANPKRHKDGECSEHEPKGEKI